MFSVIFDMDGTLLDTQKICIPAWEWAGRNQGFEGLGKHIPDVCGMNRVSWTKYLEQRYPSLDTDRFNSEARQYVIDNLKIGFMPGAEELLKYLKQNGIKLALASGSSSESVNHHLSKLGAHSYFDAIVSGDEVKNSKPAPDIFLKTAKLLGVSPEECFVFEDSENGIKAGNSAGMKCIGVPDIVDFSAEINNMLFAKYTRIDEAIALFNKLLKG